MKFSDLGFVLIITACSHANTMDVKGPGHSTSFDASAGYWKNTNEITTEDDSSQYERCQARMKGMDPDEIKVRCKDFVLAAQPDPRQPDPPPCYYGNCFYNNGWRR